MYIYDIFYDKEEHTVDQTHDFIFEARFVFEHMSKCLKKLSKNANTCELFSHR